MTVFLSCLQIFYCIAASLRSTDCFRAVWVMTCFYFWCTRWCQSGLEDFREFSQLSLGSWGLLEGFVTSELSIIAEYSHVFVLQLKQYFQLQWRRNRAFGDVRSNFLAVISSLINLAGVPNYHVSLICLSRLSNISWCLWIGWTREAWFSVLFMQKNCDNFATLKIFINNIEKLEKYEKNFFIFFLCYKFWL